MSGKFQNADIIAKLKEVDSIWVKIEDTDTEIYELKEPITQKLKELKSKKFSMEYELRENRPHLPPSLGNQERMRTDDCEPSKGYCITLFVSALCYVLPLIALLLGAISIVLCVTGTGTLSALTVIAYVSFIVLLVVGLVWIGWARTVMDEFRDKVAEKLKDCSPDSSDEAWETFFEKCIEFDVAYENYISQIVSCEKEYAKSAKETNKLIAEKETLIENLEKELEKYTFISSDYVSSAWRIIEIMECEGSDYETASRKAIEELDSEENADAKTEDEMSISEALRIILEEFGGNEGV